MSQTSPLSLGTSLLGDVSGDGKVSRDDVDAFRQALLNAQQFAADHPDVDIQATADTNGDGLVNFGDLQSMAQLILQAEAVAATSGNGDLNGDGQVSEDDATAFSMALVQADQYEENYSEIDRIAAADLNRDGKVNFGDLEAFSSRVAEARASLSQQGASDSAGLTFADLQRFVDSLTSGEQNGSGSRSSEQQNLDFNQDGAVNFGDLSKFIDLLIS